MTPLATPTAALYPRMVAFLDCLEVGVIVSAFYFIKIYCIINSNKKMESRKVFRRSRSRSNDKESQERHTDFRVLAGISDPKRVIYLMINNDSVT